MFIADLVDLFSCLRRPVLLLLSLPVHSSPGGSRGVLLMVEGEGEGEREREGTRVQGEREEI